MLSTNVCLRELYTTSTETYLICHLDPFICGSGLIITSYTRKRQIVAINRVSPVKTLHWHITQKTTKLHCTLGEKF